MKTNKELAVEKVIGILEDADATEFWAITSETPPAMEHCSGLTVIKYTDYDEEVPFPVYKIMLKKDNTAIYIDNRTKPEALYNDIHNAFQNLYNAFINFNTEENAKCISNSLDIFQINKSNKEINMYRVQIKKLRKELEMDE